MLAFFEAYSILSDPATKTLGLQLFPDLRVSKDEEMRARVQSVDCHVEEFRTALIQWSQCVLRRYKAE